MVRPTKTPSDSSIPHPRKTGEVVEAFIRSCQRRNLAFDTIRWYQGILNTFAKQYPKLPTTPEPLEDFIGTFISGDERRHGAYRVLRALYNFAQERLGVANPMPKIKAPRRKVKERPALSTEQIKQLLEYPGHTQEIRALLYLLADTGARIGEASSLRSDDIFDNTVRVCGKTGSRIIPVSEVVRDKLLELGPGPLFKKTVYRLRRLVSQAFTDAGLPGFTSHSLRHSLATNWNGSDLALKQIGGWHSWAMVEHYSHRRIEKAVEEHRQHSPLARLYGNKNNERKETPQQDNGRTLNLIIKSPSVFEPEERNYPEIEVDGKMRVLYPFIALSIIPAEGWKAVFAYEDGIESKPLACFALVRDEYGSQDVQGMCACLEGVLDSADHHDNLLGYEGPGESIDWQDWWEDWHDRQKNKFQPYDVKNTKLEEN